MACARRTGSAHRGGADLLAMGAFQVSRIRGQSSIHISLERGRGSIGLVIRRGHHRGTIRDKMLFRPRRAPDPCLGVRARGSCLPASIGCRDDGPGSDIVVEASTYPTVVYDRIGRGCVVFRCRSAYTLIGRSTMTENAGRITEKEDVARGQSDLRRAVESLVKVHPDLADPERLHLFNELLNERIATQNLTHNLAARQARDRIVSSEIAAARRLMSFATAVAGAVSTGVIADLTFPSAPVPVIVGVALIGLFGSRFVARRLDRLEERKVSSSDSRARRAG
jgi:hypothetical protein